VKRGLVLTAVLLAIVIYFLKTPVAAQDHGAQPDAPPPATATPPPNPPNGAPAGGGQGGAQGGGVRFGGIVAYPDRPKAPQEVLDRGKALYSVNCAFCHASDAGGAVGPNLIRSAVVLEDKDGELIAPVVHGSRADRGMPRIDLTAAQISDIAAWLHSLHVSSRSLPPEKPINIVTGDAAAGKGYFDKTCASCHSVAGDLAGIASKIPNPRNLQQAWLLPSGPGARLGAAVAIDNPIKVKPSTVTVTFPNGQKVEGQLVYIDDFNVTVRTVDGNEHTYPRNNDKPKVEVHDPMDAHRALFAKYTDKDIHDVTAYLVTIK
jgi:cytochrome c oxidase cbb3-type subunit III